MKGKSFDAISIADIASEAGLNRATFYDHYPDKQALLACMVGTQFQDLLKKREIYFDGCDTALENTVTAMLYFLSEVAATSRDAPLERALVQVVRRLLLEGFARHPLRQEISHELAASVIAWAIYGGATEFLNMDPREAVPTAASRIAGLLKPVLLSLG